METLDFIGVITIVVQLIFLEGILSIDNAAVLGALVSVLPRDKPVPYPKPLKFLQGFTDRVFGMQQMAALKVGLLGAYAGRGLMLVLAAWVIENQFLKVLGALYLVKLAFEHLSRLGQEEEEEAHISLKTVAFWGVVLQVELADLAFSLDNVVAAVALSDKLWVVMLGVALGIVMMRFAAGIFTWMIRKEPSLEIGAYLVVFNIGVELLLAEFMHFHFEAWQKFVISILTLVLVVVYARVRPLHILGPVFRWVAQGMGLVDELVNWALRPAAVVLRLLFRTASRVIAPLAARRRAGAGPVSPNGYKSAFVEAEPDIEPAVPQPAAFSDS
ncbi:MAG: tellurium resistance protein TerC [Chloroflexi bacterium]|nr:MAG: tellurium resistance protein TerC [Chloroflexota bacterium]